MTAETDIKATIREYLKLKHIFVYHNLQGLGCYPGLPDLAMHFRGQVHYLEIKTPKGKLSPYQSAFCEGCLCDDIPYHVIRCLEDIQKIVG